MLFKEIVILLILLLSDFKTITQGSDKNMLYERAGYEFPYQLNKPDTSWELPQKLKEISGMSFIDSYRLACIQDEKGNIYIFNLKTGEIEKKIKFGGDGDYEGIEIVGNNAWVLKSNGILFKVKDYLGKSDPVVKKYATALSSKNDAEGLTFDPLNNKLLIACKGHPFDDDKEGKEYKAICSFDFSSKQIDLKPFLLIEMDTLKFYKNYNSISQIGIELLAYFDSSKGDVSFQPSGIAIHPKTGNIFVLAAVGNLLTVFSRGGEMLAIIELKSKYHPQPEGICFSTDGTLYISNEGDKFEKGTILRFKDKR